MKIIIPARLGSKGLPFKNRTLFKYTAEIIPEEYKENTWVTTDDPEIAKLAKEYGFSLIMRPSGLAQDETSIRDVLVHSLEKTKSKKDDVIITLYLTYPDRTWEEVSEALDFFIEYQHNSLSDSLLCRKEVKTHPFLCLQESGVDGAFGRQLVPHDLYRRQDYPECFEICHKIIIFKASAIHKLNKNMYCDSTVFYKIEETVDVDTQKDLDQFYGR